MDFTITASISSIRYPEVSIQVTQLETPMAERLVNTVKYLIETSK